MSDEKKDQGVDDIIESSDKTGAQSKDSDSTKEPITLEKTVELVQGLQKGYTITRQEMTEIKDNLQSIAEAMNTKTGATTGDEEYLTVGKLKEILTNQQADAEQRKEQANSYIDNEMTSLKAEGIVATKEEEQELLNYAVKIKEPNLRKAATIWQDIKEARGVAKKEADTKKAKQEAGGKIGTSGKTTAEEHSGVDYRKVRNMDWYNPPE